MKSGDIRVDWGELKSDRVKNFRERIWFIKYWVNYMKTHPAAEWSRGQTDFIDSQFESAESFWRDLERRDKKKFEKMKRLRLRVRKNR